MPKDYTLGWNTKRLTKIDPRENPVALQIFGSDPEIMAIVTEKYINPRVWYTILDNKYGLSCT